MRRALLLFIALVSTPCPKAWADYLEVRRPAIIRQEPDRESGILARLSAGTTLSLAAVEQEDGYYRVSGSFGSGWIYRTFVRRHLGPAPVDDDELSGGSGGAAGLPDASSSSGTLDVGAFRDADCPLEGSAQFERVRSLNRLKNRTRAPHPQHIRQLGLDELLFPGDDRERWQSGNAIEVVAYVYDVKKGGIETCNCGATEALGRDTHIELTLKTESTDATDRVVVEVTPAWRAYQASRGVDWSTKSLTENFEGHWVKIQGWMMFDTEHADEAENTAPGRVKNWRGTAWEIHPITSLQILSDPVQ